MPVSLACRCCSRMSSCSWRLTTSKRVAGVDDTFWIHNWPFSIHSLTTNGRKFRKKDRMGLGKVQNLSAHKSSCQLYKLWIEFTLVEEWNWGFRLFAAHFWRPWAARPIVSHSPSLGDLARDRGSREAEGSPNAIWKKMYALGILYSSFLVSHWLFPSEEVTGIFPS